MNATAEMTLPPPASRLIQRIGETGCTVQLLAVHGPTVEYAATRDDEAVSGVLILDGDGRVLRAAFTFGDDERPVKAEGLAEVRELVSRIAPYLDACAYAAMVARGPFGR